jgi:hypothetical protein
LLTDFSEILVSDPLTISGSRFLGKACELLINRRLRRLELSLSDNGSVVIEHAECGGPIAYYKSSPMVNRPAGAGA